MGLLDRLFRRPSEASPAATETAATSVKCPHVTRVARWDSVDDMGKEDRASSFTCTACNGTFTPEETAALRADEAERIRRDLA